ncbi:HD domain-containing protein [Actinophytocola sp. NPDC049390]|uniref:HD domain-containing protein n=1 Tax=Actinophytocola sp. NPDC049390 TaxID=3363894 RepID=UPI003792EDB5
MPPETMRDVVTETERVVRDRLGDEPTGHDWWHADRVRRTALHIAEEEGADPVVVELAALLHDVEDYKFSGSEEAGPAFAHAHLTSLAVEEHVVTHVADIIRHMSFKGANVALPPLSLEGKCVQDADRLDAMGAMGIARTFAYGGFVGRPIHDPETAPFMHDSAADYMNTKGTSLNHFDEKLLLLASRMNTVPGKRLAEERHVFMERFLQQFRAEWSAAPQA